MKAATFKERVLDIVSNIPEGKVLTYAEVARRAGSAKACRAVGSVLHGNYDPRIPCHRVVRSDGKLGGYNRGADKKREILSRELGVDFAKAAR